MTSYAHLSLRRRLTARNVGWVAEATTTSTVHTVDDPRAQTARQPHQILMWSGRRRTGSIEHGKTKCFESRPIIFPV